MPETVAFMIFPDILYLSSIYQYLNLLFEPINCRFFYALQSLDTEALGLLSWLASSQAAEDFSVDDELVHEAILSPLLSAKSYKEALEIAHSDYDIASQKECKDILDSLEGFCCFEGSKEQVSCSTDQGPTISVSSGNAIPQVDGSFDDDFSTPQKGHLSEANMTSGSDKHFVHQAGSMGRCNSSRSVSKQKRSKLLWGPLPFAFKQQEQENSEPAVFNSCHDEEMKSESESSSLSGGKGNICCDAGLENYDEKERKLLPLSSARDLMRRKRCLRTEQLDTVVQNIGTVDLCTEEAMHHKSEIETCKVITQDRPNIKSCTIDKEGAVQVQESVTCTRACTHHDYCSPTNQKSLVLLSSDQVIQSNIPLDEHLHCLKREKSTEGGCIESIGGSRGFAVTSLSMPPHVGSIKFCELDQSRNSGTATCSTVSGGNKSLKLDASQKFTSFIVENSQVDDGLEFHKCGREPVYEPLEEKVDINLTTVHVEQALAHDTRESRSSQDNKITQDRCLQTHTNRCSELDSALDKDIENSENDSIGDQRNNSLKPDFEPCIVSSKTEDNSEYVHMTFSRKPPSRDEVGKCPEDSAWTVVHAKNSADLNSEF